MPDLFIPDEYGIAFLRWRCDNDPEEMVSTFGIRASGPAVNGQDLAISVDDAMTAAGSLGVAGNMTAEYSYVGTKVILHTAGGLDIGQVDNVVDGTSVNESLVNNAAILVKKLTASAGRWNRGRMFLPPAYIGMNLVSANGLITSGGVASIQGWVDAFIADLTADTEVEGLYLLHYPRTDPPSPSPDPTPDPTPITGWPVQNKLATVRRRLRP